MWRVSNGGSALASPCISVRSAAILAACLFQLFLSACSYSGYSNRNKLRLVTQNMYEGTNFQELAAAKSANDFVQAVTTTYRGIQSTNPAERAAAIAREIAATSPHLVALQEASILRTGAAPPATEVQSDLLQRLLDSLERSGQHYTVISVLQGLDAEVPSTLGFDVRLTTQDAVLARSDLSPTEFSWSNVQTQHYKAQLSFPSPAGPIPFPRGYISIDASINGHAFRFVTTHLEVDPQIDTAQAAELAAIEGASPLPVVIAGDFNAVADDASAPSFEGYRALTRAGFGDAWTIAHPKDLGYTCCQDGDLHNTLPALTHRIDLVLVKGGFEVDSLKRIGVKASDRTRSGLWPSDHAGLLAALGIP